MTGWRATAPGWKATLRVIGASPFSSTRHSKTIAGATPALIPATKSPTTRMANRSLTIAGWRLGGLKQIRDSHLKFRQQFLRKEFAAGQDAFQNQTVGAGMIYFHIVVAGINHPEPRQSHLFVDLFLHDCVRAMIVGTHDFRRQPKPATGPSDQRQIGTNDGRR